MLANCTTKDINPATFDRSRYADFGSPHDPTLPEVAFSIFMSKQGGEMVLIAKCGAAEFGLSQHLKNADLICCRNGSSDPAVEEGMNIVAQKMFERHGQALWREINSIRDRNSTTYGQLTMPPRTAA